MMSSRVSASSGISLHSNSFELMRRDQMGASSADANGSTQDAPHGEMLVDVSSSNVFQASSVSVSRRVSKRTSFNPTNACTTQTRGNDEISEFSSENAKNSNDHIIVQLHQQSHQQSHHLHQKVNKRNSTTHQQLNSNGSSRSQSPKAQRRSQRVFELENTTGDIPFQYSQTRLTVPADRGIIILSEELTLMQEGESDHNRNQPTNSPHLSNLHRIDDTYSASYLPRSAMGNSRHHREHCNPWGTQGASVDMEEESTPNQPTERKDRDDDSYSAASTASVTLASPGMNPIHGPESSSGGRDQGSATARLPISVFGTPSTVSTDASTDDVSIDALLDPLLFERLSLKIDDPFTSNGVTGVIAPRTVLPPRSSIAASQQQLHRRSTSWEGGRDMHQQGFVPQLSQPPNTSHGPHTRHLSDIWNVPSQARVATFRADSQVPDQHAQYGYPQVPHTDAWRQQRRFADRQMYHMSQQMAHLPPSGQYHHSRKGSNGPPTTPPRNRQSRPGQPRQAGSSLSANTGPPGSSNPPRSPSEVLKTLLRKKACLYEPDTSRAVALVTWLVGRELALHHGYFSRQQLQSGVHACVAAKIDSGAITRTKVNRCMQIILNSCFHYIIPRPDGSEEKGDSFRRQFEGTSQDEHGLLSVLPPPWNDVVVQRDVVLQASIQGQEEGERQRSSPKNSPHQSPRMAGVEGPNADQEGGESHTKRAVLLCFNENVRSAEDVFRCHNEFIRDTANASKLQLSANEWRAFFGRNGPHPTEKGSQQDFFGHMSEKELDMFRTSWCAKRYDHDHELCGFAHLEVNGGWLRRVPSVHMHHAEICPDVISIEDEHTGKTSFRINQCRNGTNCQLAHSREEIIYHPSQYKKRICSAAGHCNLGDVCPNYHHPDSPHHVRRPSNEYRTSHQRHLNRQHHHGHENGSMGHHDRGGSGVPLPGAPTLYVSPAPFSSFERHLQMPGLQNLFRRNSAVLQAQQQRPNQVSFYSNFGDDCGVGGKASAEHDAFPSHGVGMGSAKSV
mmetsp:Transcript_21055/g.34832  ORF Transcript_21055/g.34832 Transcript_21055/m.34832 type:complete len:1014 (+) Transcript_21055:814-3855(+)|eukprot:CAMPEP_0119010230 /NCGR_PEP_ID=MMETSP1176-20130426/4875_1 /TAXON_ID=265551 /ORGANISM="Synedropsis recta cf, Strain CCMP1620" /LENGTH=1013 /DNA_ID=CAMNT_0006962857 /DNA_START=446 /DNA_END=3487 /DNA_ORIENTATION=-